ncbi:MAG: VanW family protein [Microgenomates group bacterium]
MIKNLILSLYFTLFSSGIPVVQNILPQKENVLSSRTISLENRYPSQRVSDVFKDNILLNLAYLDGRVNTAKDINWSEMENSFRSEFTLQPDETFAYHDAVLSKYEGKVAKTTEAHFNSQDGFKTDGYLYGDGVCHLASLINWAARDANLEVLAPTNHNFANIPEVPKEYGVSIYYNPANKSVGANQNLYITNNQNKPINFVFEYKDGQLSVTITTQA